MWKPSAGPQPCSNQPGTADASLAESTSLWLWLGCTRCRRKEERKEGNRVDYVITIETEKCIKPFLQDLHLYLCIKYLNAPPKLAHWSNLHSEINKVIYLSIRLFQLRVSMSHMKYIECFSFSCALTCLVNSYLVFPLQLSELPPPWLSWPLRGQPVWPRVPPSARSTPSCCSAGGPAWG